MYIKSLVISVFMLIPAVTNAQGDSLNIGYYINSIQNELATLKEENAGLSQQNKCLQHRVSKVEADIRAINSSLSASDDKARKLEAKINQNANNLSATIEELGGKIDTTQENINEQGSILKTTSVLGAIIATIVLTISVLLSILLHKKGNAKIEELKKRSDKLNEEIVNKLSVEILDMQKISTSIGALSAAGSSTENEQDLIKTLADRITFMEMTIYKMDSSVKGYKQLSRSISQMKDNMLASGYELVDMLGKPYSEGMKATASFEDDDTLEEGARVITKVIKPQINYKGVMIQNAQITVSQNI